MTLRYQHIAVVFILATILLFLPLTGAAKAKKEIEGITDEVFLP